MSLRDANKQAVIRTGNNPEKTPSGSLRPGQGSAVQKPTGQGLAAVQKAVIGTSTQGAGNIGFIIDATASRSDSWGQAQKIQEMMFQKIAGLGSMRLRLVHYGGKSLKDLGWAMDADKIASAMAGVRCVSGETQIITGLQKFIDDTTYKATSIILVGDSFEESMSQLEEISHKLAEKNIKVFAFLDGSNRQAQEAFEMLATNTGGAFARFDSNMPLDDLCAGVALVSVGGTQALHRLQNAAARQLLLNSAKPS